MALTTDHPKEPRPSGVPKADERRSPSSPARSKMPVTHPLHPLTPGVDRLPLGVCVLIWVAIDLAVILMVAWLLWI